MLDESVAHSLGEGALLALGIIDLSRGLAAIGLPSSSVALQPGECVAQQRRGDRGLARAVRSGEDDDQGLPVDHSVEVHGLLGCAALCGWRAVDAAQDEVASGRVDEVHIAAPEAAGQKHPIRALHVLRECLTS